MMLQGRLAQQLTAEFSRERVGLVGNRKVDPDHDAAVDVVIAEHRRLETSAVEPGAHARHLAGERGIGDADLGRVQGHADTPLRCSNDKAGRRKRR
jgi:hypothetical protein